MASSAFALSAARLRQAAGTSSRASGSTDTNRSAMNYFNKYQQSVDEPVFAQLTAAGFNRPQDIQEVFFNWACFMIEDPPTYQGRPVDPDTTVSNYFGLVKTRFQEDPRFRSHPDWEEVDAWFPTYQQELVKSLNDKIHKGKIDADYEDVSTNVPIFRQMKVTQTTKASSLESPTE